MCARQSKRRGLLRDATAAEAAARSAVREKEDLAQEVKALRRHLSLKKGRKAAAGIIEVSCLGVCPKGAVTVVNGAASREWLLVRPGADLDELARTLALTPPAA